MPYEWDPAKAAANLAKHGVTFEDAAAMLRSGADYLEFYDADHSEHEDRFVAIGQAARGVLYVVFVEREDDVIRIVSARPATRDESSRYVRWARGRTP